MSIIRFLTLLLPLFLSAQSVHVLMPVYNAEPYLAKSLESVFMQSHKETLLIAYNDGSTDDSISILNKYKGAIVLLDFEKNKGIANARDSLIRKSFEVDEEALILWLDSDDSFTGDKFIDMFVQQMDKTGADICLFNFDILLDDDQQANNINGLLQEKKGHEEVLDLIYRSPNQSLTPSEIKNIMNVTSLGWTKGYSKIKWPNPCNCPYEDFAYMAALYNANKITALPSCYKPVQYLRRSSSITGKRTAKTFSCVLAQLEKFIQEIQPEKKELHKKSIHAFLKRKLSQYEELLESLVSSDEHPDITPKTLDEYRLKASKLLK